MNTQSQPLCVSCKQTNKQRSFSSPVKPELAPNNHLPTTTIILRSHFHFCDLNLPLNSNHLSTTATNLGSQGFDCISSRPLNVLCPNSDFSRPLNLLGKRTFYLKVSFVSFSPISPFVFCTSFAAFVDA